MTRIFESTNEALNEIERDIMEMGIKVHTATMQNKVVKDDDSFSTIEVQNYSFTILDTSDKSECIDAINYQWCVAEFLERVSGKEMNPGKSWLIRKDTWEPFLSKNGKMDYTYADRYSFDNTQFDNVVKILKGDPDSRQAILHMHFPEDVVKAVDMENPVRIPCSMYYQFMIRRGKLDVIYNMRSSDYDTHFRNDIWLADELRNYICSRIQVEPGLFHMNVGSLHRYKNYTKKHVF